MENIKTFLAIIASLGMMQNSTFVTIVNNSTNDVRDTNNVYINRELNKDIIIDTDLGSDVDDATCLRIATELDTEGIINIKAVCTSLSGNNAVKAVDGILTHDRIDNVIIGESSIATDLEEHYLEEMVPFASNKYEVYDAVSAYRKVLAESTGLVDIATTGYVTNLEKLLQSEPDEYSSLSGVELVKNKVGQLYVVGGSYTEGYDSNFYSIPEAANAVWYINEYWPLPIVYFLNNQANVLTCGAKLEEVDTDNKDIVSKALRKYGMEHGYIAWDPYGVMLAAYGVSDECKSHIERANTIIDKETGYNVFTIDENGKHYIVFRNDGVPYEYYNNMLDNILLKKYYEIYGY